MTPIGFYTDKKILVPGEIILAVWSCVSLIGHDASRVHLRKLEAKIV